MAKVWQRSLEQGREFLRTVIPDLIGDLIVPATREDRWVQTRDDVALWKIPRDDDLVPWAQQHGWPMPAAENNSYPAYRAHLVGVMARRAVAAAG